eukprot:Pgem_evm1s12420
MADENKEMNTVIDGMNNVSLENSEGNNNNNNNNDSGDNSSNNNKKNFRGGRKYNRSNGPRNCFHCGKPGHLAQNCPRSGEEKICYNCNGQ